MPRTVNAKTLAPVIVGTATFASSSKSFMLTFDVQPAEVKKGRLGISLLPEKGERAGCEFQIAWTTSARNSLPRPWNTSQLPRSPCAKAAPLSRPATTQSRILSAWMAFSLFAYSSKGDDKLGGSLIDAEITGQRTMISYRPDLTVRKLVFRADGVEFKKVRMYPLLNM